jgi:hypothetical protein
MTLLVDEVRCDHRVRGSDHVPEERWRVRIGRFARDDAPVEPVTQQRPIRREPLTRAPAVVVESVAECAEVFGLESLPDRRGIGLRKLQPGRVVQGQRRMVDDRGDD